MGGTAVVALVAWGTSFLVEAYDFPAQVADVAVRQPKKLLQGMTPTEYRQRSAEEVRDYLGKNYAPGGAIGYARWALTSGRVIPPVGMLLRPFESSQPPVWWGIRVALSIVLLFAGIYSQVAPLKRLPAQHDHEGTTVNPLSRI